MKKSKNWHFSKGVNPWFWSKNGHFSNFVFSGNIGQTNVFYDILERKNDFQGYQNKKLKKSKNWHLSKRVNPLFWSKNGHFSNFFFSGHIGQANVFYDILERNNDFLGYKKKEVEKVEKLTFFPWFWFKNGHFSNFVFSGIRGQENVFYDILERNNAFLGYRNKKLKNSKNWHFSKGFNPWFWSKNGHFFNFVFSGNEFQANVFYNILEQKKRYSRL